MFTTVGEGNRDSRGEFNIEETLMTSSAVELVWDRSRLFCTEGDNTASVVIGRPECRSRPYIKMSGENRVFCLLSFCV